MILTSTPFMLLALSSTWENEDAQDLLRVLVIESKWRWFPGKFVRLKDVTG